jgi:hypothetical protein
VNNSTVNFFDLCAIAPPLPAGLVLVVHNDHDRRLLGIAATTAPLFVPRSALAAGPAVS